MTSRQRIPEDLARRAPGPGLAAVLAGVELSRLTGFDAVEVLAAEYRQLAHAQARYLAALAEVGHCDHADTLSRVAVPGQFAAEEARAVLVLTRRKADEEFWFAEDLLTRLPAVHTAMLAGDCDRARAWLIAEWTTDLTTEQARSIAERLLPRIAAGELTTGQLIARLKTLATALDPDWARRRYETALQERRVVGFRNPDGTANLAGYHLPLERVAAASAHIDQLAKAAKRAGSRRRLDHLRAELFCGMTDGTYLGLTDADIIALLLATPEDDTDEPTSRGDRAAGAGDLDQVADEGAAPPGETGEPVPTQQVTREPVSAQQVPREPGGDELATAEDAATGQPAPDQPASDQPAPGGPAPGGPAGEQRGRGGIELRVRLSTLLGADRHPGEIAGWGPIHAELARALAAQLGRGQWRWVLTDEHGIARQHTAHHTDGHRFADDTHRRHPGAAQRRWLQMRDRYCVRPGCRAPARDAQQDHTIDHAHGGPTLDANLGGLCAHDHQVKSEGGWDLTQDQPGQFRWTSKLGHSYDVPPRPIIEPLPEPMARDDDPDPPWLPPEGDWEHDTILEHPPPPKPEPPPARPDDSDSDPPPF